MTLATEVRIGDTLDLEHDACAHTIMTDVDLRAAEFEGYVVVEIVRGRLPGDMKIGFEGLGGLAVYPAGATVERMDHDPRADDDHRFEVVRRSADGREEVLDFFVVGQGEARHAYDLAEEAAEADHRFRASPAYTGAPNAATFVRERDEQPVDPLAGGFDFVIADGAESPHTKVVTREGVTVRQWSLDQDPDGAKAEAAAAALNA